MVIERNDQGGLVVTTDGSSGEVLVNGDPSSARCQRELLQ